MKKIGYFLGAISFVWLAVIGGADFPAPFWKNALIIIGGAIIGIAGLVSSVFLIYTAEERKKTDFYLLMEGRKSSLLRQCRRIKALKR